MKIVISESLSDIGTLETKHTSWQLIYRQLCFVDPSLRAKLSDENVAIIKRMGDEYIQLDINDLGLPIVADEVHIIASVDGSKNVIFKYANLIFMNMTFGVFKTSQDAFTGLMKYLTRVKNDKVAGSSSFIFDQPQNVSTPGGAVPLVYGRVHTGSVIISASVTTIPEEE